MQLHALDWAIIAAYFAIALGIGLWFKNRAGSSFVEYFASGRNLPWWIAGTSMVATTFAADTPPAVTGPVAKNGLAGDGLASMRQYWLKLLMNCSRQMVQNRRYRVRISQSVSGR
jgi:Na+/pantothenate symporter